MSLLDLRLSGEEIVQCRHVMLHDVRQRKIVLCTLPQIDRLGIRITPKSSSAVALIFFPEIFMLPLVANDFALPVHRVHRSSMNQGSLHSND
jgi:hypothetical protein